MSKELAKRAIAAGFKQLVAVKPFNQITVDEICEQSNVSRRTFYRYFPDKYDIFSWIYYDEYISKVEYRDDWTIWDYFPGACVFCYGERELFVAAAQVKGQNSTRIYWREFLRPLMMHDFEGSYINPRAAEFYISYTSDALFDLMCDWLSDAQPLPPLEFAVHLRHALAMHAKRAWEIAERAPAPGSIPEGDK